MSCTVHTDHKHEHGEACGHKTIKHGDHVDYLHDGHLHHVHGDHVDEHTVCVDSSNKDTCTPEHKCDDHDSSHNHGPACGHEAVPHGDHVDYLVDGHLHHAHSGHCDDHGSLCCN
ncbi:MAG: hypothetical protein K8F91_10190 [Candidatus Obscuribacterales bacterium]|nr:hypothetical protein [Candidatus Obscuribacterales bacterium]